MRMRFNRDRLLSLNFNTSGMEFASEMIVIGALYNYLITEFPTTLKKDRRSRPPHLRTWRDGWRYLRFMLMLSPRWLFIYPGLCLIALGNSGAFALVSGPIEIAHGITLDMLTFIVASITIVVGFQITTFGLIARRFATVYSFLPEPSRFGRLIGVSLEYALVSAAGITISGAVGLVWALLTWAAIDFRAR